MSFNSLRFWSKISDKFVSGKAILIVSKRLFLLSCILFLLSTLMITNLNCISQNQSPQIHDNNEHDNSGLPTDGRFETGKIKSPVNGYIDSVFINAAGNRIYFLHSPKAVNDFMNGTSNYPMGDMLPNHSVGAGLDWNSDLYYIEWNGIAWSTPANLGSAIDGSKINSLGNECCVWLNEDETEIIFYRDTFDIAELGPRGNYRATRLTRNHSWGTPILLPDSYGSSNQSSTLYRHDIHKGRVTGDLYLWERNPLSATGTKLLYGKNMNGTYSSPSVIAASDSSKDETQVWISRDEKVMLFNRRGADGNTSLIRMSRESINSAWSDATEVNVNGFEDGNAHLIWGEPTLPLTENYMLYIQFDTSKDPWKANIMYSPGTPTTSFTTPTQLN